MRLRQKKKVVFLFWNGRYTLQNATEMLCVSCRKPGLHGLAIGRDFHAVRTLIHLIKGLAGFVLCQNHGNLLAGRQNRNQENPSIPESEFRQ